MKGQPSFVGSLGVFVSAERRHALDRMMSSSLERSNGQNKKAAEAAFVA